MPMIRGVRAWRLAAGRSSQPEDLFRAPHCRGLAGLLRPDRNLSDPSRLRGARTPGDPGGPVDRRGGHGVGRPADGRGGRHRRRRCRGRRPRGAGGPTGRRATRGDGPALRPRPAGQLREGDRGVPALTVSRPHTDRFESVGVSWAEDPGVTEVSVQLRVRHKSGDWGRWTTVTQDDVALETASKAGKPDVRGGTAPYWTGDGYGVEVIVQAPDGTTPRDVQVSLIDPGTSPADAAPGAPAVKDEAHAAMTMPAIYSRAQWGADESLMGWDPEYAPTIQ